MICQFYHRQLLALQTQLWSLQKMRLQQTLKHFTGSENPVSDGLATKKTCCEIDWLTLQHNQLMVRPSHTKKSSTVWPKSLGTELFSVCADLFCKCFENHRLALAGSIVVSHGVTAALAYTKSSHNFCLRLPDHQTWKDSTAGVLWVNENFSSGTCCACLCQRMLHLRPRNCLLLQPPLPTLYCEGTLVPCRILFFTRNCACFRSCRLRQWRFSHDNKRCSSPTETQ